MNANNVRVELFVSPHAVTQFQLRIAPLQESVARKVIEDGICQAANVRVLPDGETLRVRTARPFPYEFRAYCVFDHERGHRVVTTIVWGDSRATRKRKFGVRRLVAALGASRRRKAVTSYRTPKRRIRPEPHAPVLLPSAYCLLLTAFSSRVLPLDHPLRVHLRRRGGLREALDLGSTQFQIRSFQIVFQLRHLISADDDRGDAGLGQ